MPRWLMKFEVEAHLGVVAGVPRLILRHPKGHYEVQLENHQMQPGMEVPLLNAYLLFEADTIEAADLLGEKLMKQFLDFLAFTTGSRFRVKRPLCLFDWTTGVQERHGYVYRYFPDPGLPQLVLSDRLVPALELLLASDDEPDLMQALHWFSVGVSAGPSDEQFELFWFAIETLARYSGSKDKVPDLCARCREPLFCRKCDEVSTHRPYPSQAIRQLFVRHVSNDPERAFRLSSTMRHALLHGDEVAKVEQENGVTLSQLVDVVGKLAWVALLDALVRRTAEDRVQVGLIQPTTFLHHRVAFKAHVGIQTPVDREPAFSDLPNFEVDLIVEERPAIQPDA